MTQTFLPNEKQLTQTKKTLPTSFFFSSLLLLFFLFSFFFLSSSFYFIFLIVTFFSFQRRRSLLFPPSFSFPFPSCKFFLPFSFSMKMWSILPKMSFLFFFPLFSPSFSYCFSSCLNFQGACDHPPFILWTWWLPSCFVFSYVKNLIKVLILVLWIKTGTNISYSPKQAPTQHWNRQ